MRSFGTFSSNNKYLSNWKKNGFPCTFRLLDEKECRTVAEELSLLDEKFIYLDLEIIGTYSCGDFICLGSDGLYVIFHDDLSVFRVLLTLEQFVKLLLNDSKTYSADVVCESLGAEYHG